MDFMKEATKAIRQHTKENLPGKPVAVLTIVIDEDGNEIYSIFSTSSDKAERLAVRAAATAAAGFASIIPELSTPSATLQ